MFNLSQVIVDAKKALEEDSATDIRFNHNFKIFNRFIEVSESAKSDVDFHKQILKDFDLFCIAYVRLDNRKPMYPAPWQSKAARTFEEHSVNLFIEPRKIGKSAVLSAYVLWKMCKDASTRAVIFAPTQAQLFIMEDIWKALKRCDYLMNEYVQPSAPMNKRVRTVRNTLDSLKMNQKL